MSIYSIVERTIEKYNVHNITGSEKYIHVVTNQCKAGKVNGFFLTYVKLNCFKLLCYFFVNIEKKDLVYS